MRGRERIEGCSEAHFNQVIIGAMRMKVNLNDRRLIKVRAQMTYVGGEGQGMEVGMGMEAGEREAEGSLQRPWMIRARVRYNILRCNDTGMGNEGKGED